MSAEAFPQPSNQERSEEREKTVEELREELLATGKVQEFIDVKQVELEKAPESVGPLTKVGLEVIDQCLQRPMVIDTQDAFKGHLERRVWRTELPLDQRAVYENSALRRNYISAALTAAGYIFEEMSEEDKQPFLAEHTELIFALEEGFQASDENPDGSLSVTEKRAYVEERLNPFLLRVRNAVVDKAK